MRTSFWQVAVLPLLVVATGAAAPIFYGVNLSVGSTGHVTGFIETDGTIGTLGAANFVDWSLKITDGVNTDTLLGPLSGNNSFVAVSLSDQSATSSAILFNFSASDNGYFFFESSISGNSDFVCFGPGGAGGFNATCAIGVASNVKGISLKGSEQNTALTGTQAVATPEPASLILLATGLAFGVFRRLRRGQTPSVS